MRVPQRHVEKWKPGWIPSDCKSIAERQNYSVADIETYSVKYDDCASPWILCHHKHSPDPLGNFFDNFGRIPVKARSYVRGVIAFPVPKEPFGFNSGDFIAVFNVQNAFEHQIGGFNVLMHETGHSLDSHAFKVPGGRLSKTAEWAKAVKADAKVSDGYAATTMAEDVAQMTVITAYDLNVPGGFKKIEPKWKDIQNTLALMKKQQHDRGDLLVPGGRCTARMENHPPVQIGGKKVQRRQGAVDDDLDDEQDLVESDFIGGGPSRRSEMPDVSLAEGLEIIPPLSNPIEHGCEH